MQFLVTLRQDWDAMSMLPALSDLIAAERTIGRQLMAEGVLLRIWRLTGQRANVGIWQAPDAAALQLQLDRLPLRRWLHADIAALGLHELEQL